MIDQKDMKPRSIPQWQLASSLGAPDHTEDKKDPELPSLEPTREEAPPSRTSLIEQASKFLDDEQIRDAPKERKVAFLESKGLINEEIHKLLGISQDQAEEKDCKEEVKAQAV